MKENKLRTREKIFAVVVPLIILSIFIYHREYHPYSNKGINKYINNLKSPVRAKRDEAVDKLSLAGDIAVKPVIRSLNYNRTQVKSDIVRFLTNILPDDKLKKLKNQFKEESRDLKIGACQVLGNIGDERAVKPLVRLLTDKEYFVKEEAAKALGKIGEPSVDAVLPLLNNKDENIRSIAVEALGLTRQEKAVKPLLEMMMEDENLEVRNTAKVAIVNVGAPAVDELVRIFRGNYVHSPLGIDKFEKEIFLNNTKNVRKRDFENTKREKIAISLLLKIRDPKAEYKYIKLLNNHNRVIREVAAEVLGEIGKKKAAAALLKVFDKEFDDYKKFNDRFFNTSKVVLHFPYKDHKFGLMCKTINSLGKLKERRCEDRLISLLEMGIPNKVTITIIKALGEVGSLKSVFILIRQLDHRDEKKYNEVILALKKINDPGLLKMLIGEYIHKEAYCRVIYESLGGGIDDKSMMDIILEKQDKKYFKLSKELVSYVGKLDDPRSEKFLLKAANNHDDEISQNAIFCLGEKKSKKAVQILIKRFKKNLDPVRMK